MNVKLHDPHWISGCRSHHRYAATFRQHRCFLAGDDSPIHRPVGAQGMNTGLQDAYNLAWKLALVLRGRGRDTLLDTYTEERITIARNSVRTTDRAFDIVTSQNFLLKNFRLFVMPLMLRMVGPVFQRIRCCVQNHFRDRDQLQKKFVNPGCVIGKVSGLCS